MQQLESQAKKGTNKGKKPELSKVSQDDFDEDFDEGYREYMET